MIYYQILKRTNYGSIVLLLLKRNIISPTKAVVCIDQINKEKEASKDLNKEFSMVKQQGLTNIALGNDVKEVLPHE